MSALSERLQNALDEGRTLVLGAQIILGLLSRGVFEPGYHKLARHSQYLTIGALGLIVLAFVLLMGPVAYHRIVDRGRNRPDLEGFVLAVMMPALPLFALSMGQTLYVATEKIAGASAAAWSGSAGTGLALILWYGGRSRRQKSREGGAMDNAEESELNDRIKHVLTEARMVLPGAQALLGFQFVTMLMDEFDRLPASSQQIHLWSLLATALTTVLLMTPAAQHRLVERGANTEAFHRLAGRFILISMIPLALSIAGDFFVVVRKVTGSVGLASATAAALLAASYGFWFGYTFYRRAGSSGDE